MRLILKWANEFNAEVGNCSADSEKLISLLRDIARVIGVDELQKYFISLNEPLYGFEFTKETWTSLAQKLQVSYWRSFPNEIPSAGMMLRKSELSKMSAKLRTSNKTLEVKVYFKVSIAMILRFL